MITKEYLLDQISFDVYNKIHNSCCGIFIEESCFSLNSNSKFVCRFEGVTQQNIFEDYENTKNYQEREAVARKFRERGVDDERMKNE
jgi:hypothetical protein